MAMTSYRDQRESGVTAIGTCDWRGSECLSAEKGSRTNEPGKTSCSKLKNDEAGHDFLRHIVHNTFVSD